MQFAVIADVHGNAHALRAVLNVIEESGIEMIYCVGDLIGIGIESNEVLEQLLTRKNTYIVTGNHDEAIVAIAKSEEHPYSHRHIKNHHTYLAERIEPQFIQKLAALPRTLEHVISGKFILFTHYGIKKGLEFSPIAQDPFCSIVEPTTENMEKMFGQHYDAVFFGHHHPHHHIQNQTLYSNPSALGCQHTAIAPYAIVTIGDVVEVDYLQVKYDREHYIEKFKQSNVPEKEFILKTFYGEDV